MKHRSLALAAFGMAALACGAQPAAAQLATGRSGSSSMTYLDASQIWPILDVYGACYAMRNKGAAFQLLATQPNSPEEAKVYRKLFAKPYQSCLGDVTALTGVPISMVRGAIAEGLYRKKVAVPAELIAGPLPADRRAKNLAEAARCYTASNPGKVKSLLSDTKVATKEEAAAVEALMPHFAQCIPAGARQLSVASTQIRYRLAEALLRMPPETTASAGNN